MSGYEKPERRFSPGDVVFHPQWGAGEVVENVNTDTEKGIVVSFLGRPNHRMSLEIASRALLRLSSNGLQALLLRDTDMVRQWSKLAPAKLIGATLADLGGAAKAGEIRRKLERSGVLTIRWPSWWKRAQPIINQSPHFRLRSDGVYQLLSAVYDIPESPLPPTSKRRKTSRLTADQIASTASRLEAGDGDLEHLRDAARLRPIARELVQRSATSENAQAVINEAITGPVLRARIFLEELSRSAPPDRTADALIHLMSNIEHLTVSSAKSRSIGEHVVAKACLLEQTGKDWIKEQEVGVVAPHIPRLVGSALQLSLTIWQRGMSQWRSESLDRICTTIALLGEKQVMTFELAGQYLASDDERITARLAVASALLANIAGDGCSEAMKGLLRGALTGTQQFAERCVSQHLTAAQRTSWISSELSRALSAGDARALTTLARLLARATPDLETTALRTNAELAIRMASVSPIQEPKLLLVIQESLGKSLGNLMVEAQGFTTQGSENPILDSIEVAYKENLDRERAQAQRQQAVLEDEIAHLRRALEAVEAESVRRRDLIEQLKSGYRLPERWAAFEGSKGILQAIVDIHQEASLVHKTRNTENESIAWVLRLLENVLERSGVAIRGQAGTREVYDPALHEYIPGSKREGNQVRIVCPAFEWQDPAGKQVLLGRAKVVGC